MGYRCLLLTLLTVFFGSVSAYRLNVPKVLLPYRAVTAVNFTLEVSDPTGGCFLWKTTRPEVATVRPLHPTSDGCSDQAEVSAVSKHRVEQTTIVFAEEKLTGVKLRCDVMVDVIKSVEIVTTTRKLFLEDAPEDFTVRAKNAQGDTFSELAGLSFEWTVTYNDKVVPSQPLRIIPFSESKYETPPAIERLEARGEFGHVILMEGDATGLATLTARLSEEHVQDVPPHSIELMVIANLILNPAHDLYLPVDAVVPYRVELMKQGRTEAIEMPSKQYYLELSDAHICQLESMTSTVTALTPGVTEIFLKDRNVEAISGWATLVRPTSAFIYVSEPASLHFKVEPGGIWVLETSRQYRIQLELVDKRGNVMLITDNMLFDVSMPTSHFEVLERSVNGSFLLVKTLKPGHVRLDGKFDAILQGAQKKPLNPKIVGQQGVEIYDPLLIDPSVIAFPWDPVTKARYQFQMKVTGGSGSFAWKSLNKQIAMVTEESGMLTTASVGTTTVVVTDLKHRLHRAEAKVVITPPTSLRFAEGPLEVEVGGDGLVIGVDLFGRYADDNGQETPIRFADCRRAPLAFAVHDAALFSLDQVATSLPAVGCAGIRVNATKSGNSQMSAKLTLGDLNLEALSPVVAYDPLTVTSDSLSPLVAIGGSYNIKFDGGPRPWILDQSKYFAALDPPSADKHLVTIRPIRKSPIVSFDVFCGNSTGSTKLTLKVGNGVTPTNRHPAVSKAVVEFSCSIPVALAIDPQYPNFPDGFPSCPSKLSITVDSAFMYNGSPQKLLVSGWTFNTDDGQSGKRRRFDDISSLILHWQSSQPEFLSLPTKRKPAEKMQTDEGIRFYEVGVPYKKQGKSLISVSSNSFKNMEACQRAKLCQPYTLETELGCEIEMKLVGYAVLTPQQLSIFNHESNHGEIEIVGGSASHHVVIEREEEATANIAVAGRKIQITPRRSGSVALSVYDVCLGPVDQPLQAQVYISDVSRIEITGPEMVELGRDIELSVRVLDERGHPFSTHFFPLMKLKANKGKTDSFEFVKREEDADAGKSTMLRYRVRGLKVGAGVFVVAGAQTSGRQIVSSDHRLQVYAPLSFEPKLVTLLTQSLFQLEIRGGPQPSPGVVFSMNDTAVASVDSRGMFEGLKLGTTLITGAIAAPAGSNHVSKDSVLVRVVSLSGVRIRAPVTRLLVGSVMPAFALGVVSGGGDHCDPFCYGGARHALTFDWSVDNTDVVAIESPFAQMDLQEQSINRFSVRIIARKPGSFSLKLKMTVNPKSTDHFAARSATTAFSDSILIEVADPLQFVQPQLSYGGNILMTPNSVLPLQMNRPSSSLSYRVVSPSGGLSAVRVDGNGVVRTPSVTADIADALLLITADGGVYSSRNQSLSLLIEVLPVSYLMVTSPVKISSAETMNNLPIGYEIGLEVGFHDSVGRPFHAVSSTVRQRLNRFDLLSVNVATENRTITTHLIRKGQNVLRVWLPDSPNVEDFVRIAADEVIDPPQRRFVVGDVICFRSRVDSGAEWMAEWLSSQAKVLEITDRFTGVGIVRSSGDVSVVHRAGRQRATGVHISVESSHAVHFVADGNSQPKFVTNTAGESFVFPVTLGKSTLFGANVIGDCTKAQLSALKLEPSFRCSIEASINADIPIRNLFSATAVFLPEIGTYACVVRWLPFEAVDKVSSIATSLRLKAERDVGNAKLSVSTLEMPFYPTFYIPEAELHLNNLQLTSTSFRLHLAAEYQTHLQVSPSHPKLFSVSSTPSSSSESTLEFTVALTSKSSHLLWQQQAAGDGTTTTTAADFYVDVMNSLNGQKRRLPVHIKVFGEAPKAAYMAASNAGFWSFMEVFMEQYGSAVLVFVSIIVTIVCLVIGYRLLSQGKYQPYGGVVDQNGSAGSPSNSYVQWRTYGSPVMNGGSNGNSGWSPYLWSVDKGRTPPNGNPRLNSSSPRSPF